MGDTSDGTAGGAAPGAGDGAAPATAEEPQRGRFGRHWRGELPLSEAFWVNGILGNLVVQFLVGMMQGLAEEFPPETYPVIRAVAGVGLACMIAFMTWQCVGIWRSAPHYRGPRIWAIAARFMVVFFVLWMLGPWLLGLYTTLRDAPF